MAAKVVNVTLVQCNCFPFPIKSSKKDDDNNSPHDHKPKELPLTSVTLEIPCKRCIKKIRKAVMLYKGVISVEIDNCLMTVKGKVDVKQLVESIRKKLEIPVEIVPEKTNDKRHQEDDSNDPQPQWYVPNGIPRALDCFSDENPNACSIS